MKHMLNWRPGEYGKGLVHDGAVHTWGVGPNQDGSPTHPEYAQQFGLSEGQYGDHEMFDTAFGINPEGALNVFDDNGWSSHPENEGKIAAEAMAVDPRLYVPEDKNQLTWKFLGAEQKWQFVKTGMPIKEDYWRMYPGALYHGTTEDKLPSIMEHGLHPWDSDVAGGSNYEDDMDWLRPRPEHVYLSPSAERAHDRAKNLGLEGRPIVIKVDPSYLKPENINPDEDEMYRHNVPNAPSPWTNSRDAPKELGDAGSLGEWAEQHGWGENPLDTQKVLDARGSVAHKGMIPPQALTPGTYDIDMNDPPPRDFQWKPIEWPRTASLIGDMRDGWGRFAVTAPWEPGKSGRGIYYPETGVLQTWADDRNHSDVWFDDENASQGNAHHIVIRPNGTVHDQGCMDRNFENAEGDVEGLQRALHELNPSLRLDSPNDWSFGPTEPVEEEPSSVSRGEDGGSVHGVQTGSDFVGSL